MHEQDQSVFEWREHKATFFPISNDAASEDLACITSYNEDYHADHADGGACGFWDLSGNADERTDDSRGVWAGDDPSK